MGKRSKQGAALRAKKRAKIANQQLEHALADHAEEQRVQSKSNDELFVLDTNRNETAASIRAASLSKRRVADAEKKKEAAKKKKYGYSEREQRKIQKLLETHGKEGAIALAEQGKAKIEHGKRIRKQTATAKPTFDLWGAQQSQQGASKKLSNKQIKAQTRAKANAPPKLAVEVAHPGQSYHPDKEHHQDAIGEALSIEIRRNEAVEYKSKPISEGMTSFTKEFIINSSDSEEESSDEEEEEEEEEEEVEMKTATKIVKRKEKLTRAQRNKQKRVKAELTAIKERKQHKQFLHQANEVHTHNKVVKNVEKEHALRQHEVAQLKQEKKSKPLGKDVWTTLSSIDPIRAPTLPVALTEELQIDGNGGGGGLRTVKPKGSLVTDRLESMVARNMISKKKVSGRRIVQGKKRTNKRRGEKGTEYLLI